MERKTNQSTMKQLLFIILICSLNAQAQKLPITGLCISDVFTATSTTCLSDAFAEANPAYFDPTYATSGNCFSEFRNYGASEIVLPTVTTSAVTYYSSTSSNGGGNVTSLGGAANVYRGLVWNTTTNPTTTSNIGLLAATTTTGAFTYNMSSLTAGTTYYVRAFATNSAGTSYGDNVSWVQGSGLNQYVLGQHILRYSDSTDWDFYNMTYVDAQYAIGLHIASTGSISYIYYKYAASITVGQAVYQTNSESGTPVPDGYYSYNSGSWYIVTIVSGVITAVTAY